MYCCYGMAGLLSLVIFYIIGKILIAFESEEDKKQYQIRENMRRRGKLKDT